MANVFDYLHWRGDLQFTQDEPNEIDALIFSSLAYIQFPGSIEAWPDEPFAMKEAWKELSMLPDCYRRGRNKNDIDLLKAASETARFAETQILNYRQIYSQEEETQFAAMTFLLSNGMACIAFRGTDTSLTGWKEDLNMMYQSEIPSQRLALEYTQEMQIKLQCPLILCGHSKGGNLAVYAAAKSSPMEQSNILAVYNNDGPGFTQFMLGDPGYKAMVPKIRTYVPQSSIIGLLMEHEEPYTIIKSNQISVMQHDTFNWEVLGKSLIPVEEITPDSRFLDVTIDNWLKEMDMTERSQWIDAVFKVLATVDSDNVQEVFQPKNLLKFIKRIGSDENTHRVLLTEWVKLMNAARQSAHFLDYNKEKTDDSIFKYETKV